MEKDHLEILLEDIRSKVEVISEGYDMLNQKIDGVASELAETRRELNEKIEREVKTLHQKIDRKFEILDQKIDRVAAELNQKIDRVAAELNQKIDRVAAELNQKIDRVAAELNQKIDKVAVDLAAHRADTETHRGYQVAER